MAACNGVFEFRSHEIFQAGPLPGDALLDTDLLFNHNDHTGYYDWGLQ